MDISIDGNKNPLTRDGIIQPHVQDMLFEFRIVPLLLDVVDSVLELVPKQEIADETYGPSLLIFMKFCYRVLRQLTKQNSAMDFAPCTANLFWERSSVASLEKDGRALHVSATAASSQPRPCKSRAGHDGATASKKSRYSLATVAATNHPKF